MNAVKKPANLAKIAKPVNKNFLKNRKHTANNKNRQKRGPKGSPRKGGEFSKNRQSSKDFSCNVLNIC